MPYTRPKSSRTITPSQKKRANQEVGPPLGLYKDKKHRRSPPKSPSSSDTSSDESEKEVATATHKKGLDPANCKFTLQHTIHLDGQQIAGTSKQYKLDHLMFPIVWQESINKAGEAAKKFRNTDKWGLEHSLATISADRVKPIISDVNGHSDWHEVK